MTEAATSNVAIIRREFRETVTFVGIPTPETTRHLRTIGFDYDRRAGQWFRTNRSGTSIDESAVLGEFVE